jgi:trehalose 6-phosphate phosphatase
MRPFFKEWNRVRPVLGVCPIALFLDFDGTLSRIVEDPDKAILPAKTRELMNVLSKLKGVRLAVISGRSLSDIKKRVGIRGIAYAGNHGLELEGPGFRYRPRIPSLYRSILAGLRRSLERASAPLDGIRIENKGLCLTFHYRLAGKSNIPRAKALFMEIAGPPLARGDVKVGWGKKILELRPPVDWDKGHAVRWMLRQREWISPSRRTMPVYAGDDLTDEDAFRVLRTRGVTIRVGRSSRSSAKYFLRDVGEVVLFLENLYDLRKAGA